MKQPERKDWEYIEEGFRTKWNFPNCCGPIDGKHVNIQEHPRIHFCLS